MVSKYKCKKVFESDLVDSDALAFSASELIHPKKSHAIDQEDERCPDYRTVAQYPGNLQLSSFSKLRPAIL